MSGSGAEKRNRAMAIRVSNLAAEGMPFNKIAKIVEKKPEQIKALRLLGERLKEAKP